MYLSVISAWEIAVKYNLGRLPLPQPPEVFVPFERQRHGVASIVLMEVDALIDPPLPFLHRDPFDRMLISQAIARDLVILTPDPQIRRYPQVRSEW